MDVLERPFLLSSPTTVVKQLIKKLCPELEELDELKEIIP